MVTASVYRASKSIGRMFKDRDVRGIAVLGGLAAIGMVVSAAVGDVINDLLNRGQGGLRQWFALMLGGAVTGGMSVGLLGTDVGGPAAVGAAVVIGLAMVGAVLDSMPGTGRFDEGHFRGMGMHAIPTPQGRPPAIAGDNDPAMEDDFGVRRVPRYRDSGPHRPTVSTGYR